MKRCPRCNRTYTDETFSFCLADGTLLSASYDLGATFVLPISENSNQPPSAIIDNAVVAININQQYKYVVSAEDLYNCTRGMWRLNRQRAERAQYAFAIYKGVVQEVYEIDRWIPVSKATLEYWVERERSQERSFPPEVHEGRSEFIGNLAPDSIRKKYVGRRLPVSQSQNPIRYFNC